MRKAALAEVSPEINISRVFQQSRDHGLEHIPEIVSAWAPRLGLPEKLISDYLTENVDYTLDQENLEGLRLFFRYAAEYQVLPAASELQFLEAPRPAAL
jgi:chorismate dehydratase